MVLAVLVTMRLRASAVQPNRDDKTLMDSGNAFVSLCTAIEKVDADKEMTGFEQI